MVSPKAPLGNLNVSLERGQEGWWEKDSSTRHSKSRDLNTRLFGDGFSVNKYKDDSGVPPGVILRKVSSYAAQMCGILRLLDSLPS